VKKQTQVCHGNMMTGFRFDFLSKIIGCSFFNNLEEVVK
jgi:hypothetical protein